MFTITRILPVTIAALALFATPAFAEQSSHQEWVLCADACDPDNAGCIDSCTDGYNKHNSASAMVPMELLGGDYASCEVELGADGRPTGDTLPVLNQIVAMQCPDGSTMTPFESPIYDEAGLFVVEYQTVWFCIEDGLLPAN